METIFFESGIIPVLNVLNIDYIPELINVYVENGLQVVEVQHGFENYKNIIKSIKKANNKMTVGVTSILTVEQVKEAVEAGADYIVTPGVCEEIINYGMDNNIKVIPGISTMTDLHLASKNLINLVKFYPANLFGGPKYLLQLAKEFKDMKFIPTGGITEENLVDYLDIPSVLCCQGEFVSPKYKEDQIDLEMIKNSVAKAVTRLHGFSLLHIGINSYGEEVARKTATDLATAYAVPLTEVEKALFAGSMFEIVKLDAPGEKGHLAILTNNEERAIAFFKRRNYKFRPGTTFLADDYGGFALHLRQKPLVEL